jgi:hypothetical protein
MSIKLLPLVLFLTACNPTVDKNVLYMGDSIMLESSYWVVFWGLAQAEAPLMMYNSVGGYGLWNNADYWIPRIASIEERAPIDAVFISLGVNDSKLDVPTVEQEIANLMAAFSPTTQVYWVIPFQELGSHVIEPLVAAAGEWPNLHLLNFKTWVGGDVAPFLEEDEIHLNDDGEWQYGKMLASVL